MTQIFYPFQRAVVYGLSSFQLCWDYLLAQSNEHSIQPIALNLLPNGGIFGRHLGTHRGDANHQILETLLGNSQHIARKSVIRIQTDTR